MLDVHYFLNTVESEEPTSAKNGIVIEEKLIFGIARVLGSFAIFSQGRNEQQVVIAGNGGKTQLTIFMEVR